MSYDITFFAHQPLWLVATQFTHSLFIGHNFVAGKLFYILQIDCNMLKLTWTRFTTLKCKWPLYMLKSRAHIHTTLQVIMKYLALIKFCVKHKDWLLASTWLPLFVKQSFCLSPLPFWFYHKAFFCWLSVKKCMYFVKMYFRCEIHFYTL